MQTKTLRARDLSQIHIAKAQLGLDDDTYRDMLYTVTRKRSAAELDAHERAQVLRHLESKGWRPRSKKAPTERIKKLPPQVRLIYAMWGLLARNGAVQDRSPSALRAWIRHWGQSEPDSVGDGIPEMLPTEIRARVADQLIEWCRRLRIHVHAVDRTVARPRKRPK